MITGWADRVIVAMTAACEESDSEARRWIVHSIFNRATIDPQRYGAAPAAVCLKRYQYSEFLPDAGDNANLERIAIKTASDPDVLDALRAYDEVAAGALDPTNGATHFYADSISEPAWAKKATYVGKAGRTLFFSDVP